MRVEIKVNGKKISKKAAFEKFGKERVENRIQEAIEEYYNDPYTLVDWMDGMAIKVYE